VFDHKINQLGHQGYYGTDLRQADGQWYIRGMSDELANAERTYREAVKADNKEKVKQKRMTPAERDALRSERDQRRALREKFRLKAKGVPAADGSQRFTYPNPDDYEIWDQATGAEGVKPTRRTIRIPREAGLKYEQKFVHREAKWSKWYALRSTVEGFNSFIKDQSPMNIEDGSKRRARGNTFAALVATLVIVDANIRKIEAFIFALARGGETTSKNRHARLMPLPEVELDPGAVIAIAAAVAALDAEPPPT